MTKKNSSLTVLKLSASAIKTYESCSRKYYYTYIDRQPKKEWAHLELGNFVHDVLEHFHKKAVSAPREQWASLVGELCESISTKYNLIAKDVIRAREMLIWYLSIVFEQGLPPVLANEQSFNIQLDEGLVVRGYIDRIDQHSEDEFEIVDYKTGKSKYLDDFQLLIYGLYLLNKEPHLESFKGSYLVLGEEKEISYKFTRTDVERCVDKIKLVADRIRSEVSWEPKPQFLCRFCDFRAICPITTDKKATEWAQQSTL